MAMGPQDYGGRKLLDETPIFLLPSLALQIGVNEAMLLQEIHWKLLRDGVLQNDGRVWVHLPNATIMERFVFWSEITIKRVIGSLRSQKLILTGKWNEQGWDRSQWITIDYEAFSVLEGIGASSSYQDETKPGITLIPSNVSNSSPAGYQDDPDDGIEMTPRTVSRSDLSRYQTAPNDGIKGRRSYRNKSSTTTEMKSSTTTAQPQPVAAVEERVTPAVEEPIDTQLQQIEQQLYGYGIRPFTLCRTLAQVPGIEQQLAWWPLRRDDVKKFTPGTLRAAIENQWGAPRQVAEVQSAAQVKHLTAGERQERVRAAADVLAAQRREYRDAYNQVLAAQSPLYQQTIRREHAADWMEYLEKFHADDLAFAIRGLQSASAPQAKAAATRTTAAKATPAPPSKSSRTRKRSKS